jgi:hypothetical protein
MRNRKEGFEKAYLYFEQLKPRQSLQRHNVFFGGVK